MDIFVWFLQKNASVMSAPQTVNSELLLAYLIVCVIIKKPAYMLAFFMSCMLFEMSLFDQLSEASLYLMTFAIYSYLIFDMRCNMKVTIACGIMIILSITLSYDAYFYGIGGKYGASDTFVYNNIEHLALCAHIILISSLISYRRITHCLRDVFNAIRDMSSYSANFVVV